MGTFGIIPVVLILKLLSHSSAYAEINEINSEAYSHIQFNKDPYRDAKILTWTSDMNSEDLIVAQLETHTLEGVQSNNKSSPIIYFGHTRVKTTITDDAFQEKIPESITDCSAPQVPAGATASTPDGTKYASVAYLSCSTEYRMKGNSTITCQDDGTWSELPSCEIIDCGELPIVNGKMSAPEGTTFIKKATVSCDDGYTLLGNVNIKCASTGKWDGSATCKVKDCGELPIVNGKMSAPEGTTFDKIATVTCDDGYTLISNANIKCASTGKWDGSATCKVKDCGELPIVKGKMSAPEGTTFDKKATVSCDDGYTLIGNANIKCASTGKWDGSATCKVKDCGELPIVNGKMSAPEGTTFDKTVTMSCDDGYTLIGNANIKCASTGKWDGSATCKVKDCGELPIVNGKMSAPEGTTFDKIATVSCDDGYTLVGNANIKCASTGKWDGSTTCAAKVTDCRSPSYITNGKTTLDTGDTTFRSKAHLRCDNGYEPRVGLNGHVYHLNSVILVCAVDGHWWTSNEGDSSTVEIESIKCTEIDECASHPCKNNGKCVDQINGYTCQCNKNYSGNDCDKDIGQCSGSPCKNGGTCLYDGNGNHYCSCTEHYENPTCTSYHKNKRNHA